MFKKIISTTILISSIAHAQIEKQILKQIELTNGGGIGVPNTAPPCETCPSENSVESLYKACVASLCYSKGYRSYLQIPIVSIADLAKPAADEKEMEDLYNQMSLISNQFPPTDVTQIIEILKSGQMNPSPENTQVAMQFLMTAVGSRVLKYDPETQKFSLDEEKYKNIPQLSAFSVKNQIALKEHIKIYAEQLSSKIGRSSEETSDSYFKSNYPGLNKVDAAKRLAADFKKDFENLKSTSIGKLVVQIAGSESLFPAELIDEIESGKDVTEMTLQELIKQKNNNSLVIALFDSKKYENAGKIIDHEDFAKYLKDPNIFQEAQALLEKDKIEDKKVLEQNRISCLSIYRYNLLTLPTATQNDNFSREIEKVKKLVRDKWATQYSTETQKTIGAYLTDVRFMMPTSKEDYQAGFKKRLNREIASRKRHSGLKIKDHTSLAYFLTLRTMAERFKADESDGQKMDGLCEKDKLDPLNDANYTLQGKIQVSHTSVLEPELGSGVVAHELGHGVSQIFKAKKASDQSSKRHQSFLTCISSLHSKNGSQYVEEDYADFVSANITASNKACFFPYTYSATTPVLENSYTQATHSSEIFRLLHMESIQRGKIPDECNQLLVMQRTPKDFLSCQKLVTK